MDTATGLPDASAWALEPGLAYLNHGGFGAAPVCVLNEQQALRSATERNPVGFLADQLPELLGRVRAEVAAFLGADSEGTVFVDTRCWRPTASPRPTQSASNSASCWAFTCA